ncbi:hybrid sensor histidine kinase/response regulator [Roseateles violae]|uniref:histidine kinase n=1 Tax=Roseateles violae TaxID=3058042 RepID=A0ABT8DYI6_9BURK|nr:hybrid sensor histidine kinase/response regulator [Pelomonas sp. PFR6]MDN3922647.1 hybrid sensor histidine kinase/response regulator [Pelomonas sp. PFR6]
MGAATLAEADGAGALAASSDDAARYDSRRLDVLVRFSAALRLQMTLVAFVIAALAWIGGAQPRLVLVWLLLVLAVREARAAAIKRLGQQHARPIAPRMRQVAWMTLALGLAQGSSALLMLQLEIGFAALLTMVLLSLSAGAVSTTYTVPAAFVAYVGGIALPAATMWLLRADSLSISIAALVLLFMAVQIRFARQNMQLFDESYRMRLENMTLLQQLTEERRQLARARDAAVQANRSKSGFLAAASHDLRQPLQSLSLNSSALSRRALDAESRAIAGEIGAGIEALRQMLDALLDVSKLDAGVVTPLLRPIPLDRLLQALCGRFRPAAEARGLLLSADCPEGLVVSSDVGMLQRLLSNLIDNAIKFTAQGGVRLSVQAQPTHLLLTVQDSGIGIAEADQQRVFEDLVQLGNPQRDRSCGHGLGLGIVRRLAQLLGIEYSIESRLGEGTRFHLRLPRGDAAPAPSADALRAAGPSLARRRVLVLDDDPAVRSAYAHALQGLGCEVCCSASLAEALAALPQHEPEIALVDYRLAEAQDGFEAITRLRAERPGLAAVIVSADSSAALREQAARVGVPMLRKPASEAMLAAAIDDGLRDRHDGDTAA